MCVAGHKIKIEGNLCWQIGFTYIIWFEKKNVPSTYQNTSFINKKNFNISDFVRRTEAYYNRVALQLKMNKISIFFYISNKKILSKSYKEKVFLLWLLLT